MRFVVVAHRRTDVNQALARAAASLAARGHILTPRDALRNLQAGDVALGRLDVRDSLDGIESGSTELERLAAAGVEVLNEPSALPSAHDKLLTARALRLAGLPHPRTWLVAAGTPFPAPELPLVLKPRFGSWGRDVVLCRTAAELEEALAKLASRPWFREHGAVVQELVPPQGRHLRLVVAAGTVVGAARRVAAPGEWRTNVSLGGRSEPAAVPPLARKLALAAAAAIRADLVGVDLLPTRTGFVVSDINGAVEFRPWYALDAEDVYEQAVSRLLRRAGERRVAAAS